MPLRIDEFYAYVAIDPDGDEALVGYPVKGEWRPFVCADKARFESLRPLAQRIANESGQTIRLLQFHTRVELGEIKPELKN